MSFEDVYPGKPKILFIGLARSSHTHGWMNLLSGEEINIRLFGLPQEGIPPDNWGFQTYLSAPKTPEDLDITLYQHLYRNPKLQKDAQVEKISDLLRRILQQGIFIDPFFYRPKRTLLIFLLLLITFPYQLWQIISGKRKETNVKEIPPITPEQWLKEIIEDWQPDIIHTLGVFDQQGGEFFYHAVKNNNLQYKGKWVLQLRGGSDLALRHCNPQMTSIIRSILHSCDYIISDNIINIRLAENFDISKQKFAEITPIPGSGGIDLDFIKSQIQELPSKRRIILWPKAYDLTWTKGTSVFEALKICWDQIQPCEVYMLNTSEEIVSWVHTLPENMQDQFFDLKIAPRKDFFSLLAKSRVMLAPSLVDGIPNSLYEAMAAGAFPIVSPLDTIRTVVCEPQNVLFARNLYPEEIASALIRAMNDNQLVDQAAETNALLVQELADKKILAKRATNFYTRIFQQTREH